MGKKFYAVKQGLKPGVYTTWDECKDNVHGHPGAIYKSFPTLEEALRFVGIQQEESTNVEPSNSGTIATDGEKAVAYVDGSYNVANGQYSCGVVLFHHGKEEHIAERGTDESLASMRNVAGEILGARRAMEESIRLGMKEIDIYHDYQGIASWCLGEWKSNKEGTKNYKAYYDSIQGQLKVNFIKVKGHSSDKYNDLADELAKSAIFE